MVSTDQAAIGCYTTILGTHTGHTILSSGMILGTGTAHGFTLHGTGTTLGSGMILGTMAITELISEDIMPATELHTTYLYIATITTHLWL